MFYTWYFDCIQTRGHNNSITLAASKYPPEPWKDLSVATPKEWRPRVGDDKIRFRWTDIGVPHARWVGEGVTAVGDDTTHII